MHAYKPCLGARRVIRSLQYVAKIKSLSECSTHDVVLNNKYMKLFNARHLALVINHFGNTFILFYHLGTSDNHR